MGHATKEMVYETYGKYVEGLEHDKEKILQLFGEDFLTPGVEMQMAPIAKVPRKSGANCS